MDIGKRNGASLFSLPSQAAVEKESFFRYYDENREVLDPATWISNSVVPDDDVPLDLPLVRSVEIKNDNAVQSAIDQWHLSPEGSGNSDFFVLAVKFRTAGLNGFEIETRLREQALLGRSPKERLAQIPSILRSLKSRVA